ncbi:hypothetical protein Krac_11452 [Ktedonobacter racemifer DSM 44963]|uniref:Uncharacterized protein n=1 Tax=Ktedonobacter racemifer DSM 44963 TaxID=485913 RepID=D6TBT6_KTERA|nr:hypothetical protein Krac_11452 [Ktedonobacter racemifer DSM 44963]
MYAGEASGSGMRGVMPPSLLFPFTARRVLRILFDVGREFQ